MAENNGEVLPDPVENHDHSKDGRFEVTSNDEGVFLTIYPPQEGGLPVAEPAIVRQLEQSKIKNYNRAILQRMLKTPDGKAVKIAEAPKPPTDLNIQVLVARDRMEASLEVNVPDNCREFSIDEVMAKIQQAGVSFGIIPSAVQYAYDRPGQRVVCARGQKPQDGTDAYIKFFVDTEKKGRPAELEDGRVDFKDLNLFTIVHQGDVLAEKIPATPGSPGMDVLGQIVPPKPGKDIPFPLGKNVAVDEQQKIIATISGQFLYTNNKINVIPVIEIKNDVDLSTGNIDFVGSVIIRGSVQAGFKVKAEGNIEIMGTVSGGTVEGKNVVVRMGILGMNRGVVRASESVTTKFIENATVYAAVDVVVSNVILHSRVCAGKRVIVEGQHGLIIGGQISAGEEVRAKVLGNPLATATEIQVGVNPELREEYLRLQREIKQVEATLDQARKGLNILSAMNPVTMPPDKREMMLKLTKLQFNLAGQFEMMRNRMAEIELAFEEMRSGRIRASETVYPGVRIVIGSLVRPIRDAVKFVSFYADEGEIKVGAYK